MVLLPLSWRSLIVVLIGAVLSMTPLLHLVLGGKGSDKEGAMQLGAVSTDDGDDTFSMMAVKQKLSQRAQTIEVALADRLGATIADRLAETGGGERAGRQRATLTGAEQARAKLLGQAAAEGAMETVMKKKKGGPQESVANAAAVAQFADIDHKLAAKESVADVQDATTAQLAAKQSVADVQEATESSTAEQDAAPAKIVAKESVADVQEATGSATLEQDAAPAEIATAKESVADVQEATESSTLEQDAAPAEIALAKESVSDVQEATESSTAEQDAAPAVIAAKESVAGVQESTQSSVVEQDAAPTEIVVDVAKTPTD